MLKVFAIILFFITGIAHAAPLEKDLIGTWSLAEIQVRTSDEQVAPDILGPDPKGMIIFDRNGHVSAHFMRSDIPKYAANNRFQGTPEENKATVHGYIGYYGMYYVEGTDVLIYIEGSSFPNWTKTIQRRIGFSVVGDEMRYVMPSPSVGGAPITLLWKRVK